MARSGGKPRRLAAIAGDVMYIHVAVGGTVYVSTRDPGGRHVLRLPLAGGAPEVEPDGGLVVLPAPPGGAPLVLTKGEARSVPAGQPLAAPTARLEYNHFLTWADGKSVIYMKGVRVLRHDFETGGDTEIDVGAAQIAAMAVAPDGRTLWLAERHT